MPSWPEDTTPNPGDAPNHGNSQDITVVTVEVSTTDNDEMTVRLRVKGQLDIKHIATPEGDTDDSSGKLTVCHQKVQGEIHTVFEASGSRAGRPARYLAEHGGYDGGIIANIISTGMRGVVEGSDRYPDGFTTSYKVRNTSTALAALTEYVRIIRRLH